MGFFVCFYAYILFHIGTLESWDWNHEEKCMQSSPNQCNNGNWKSELFYRSMCWKKSKSRW